MAKYLISFSSAAMVVPEDELRTLGSDGHAVIEEAKAAGAYVFAGGIDNDIPPVLVSADGACVMGGFPWAPTLDGSFTVLELPSRGRRASPRPVVASRNCVSSGLPLIRDGCVDMARQVRSSNSFEQTAMSKHITCFLTQTG